MIDAIPKRLNEIRFKIRKAAVSCQRNPQDIKLIAISKKKSNDHILKALSCEQFDFGENYAQELSQKILEIQHSHVKWHFTGHLQRNKVKYIVGKTHLIHTLDRLSLAETIDKLSKEKGIVQNTLVQVKISKEHSKTGCPPEELEALLKQLDCLQNIKVMGLMIIGTWTDDKNISQKEFSALRILRDELNQKNAYRNELIELSMGMSHDFELAIQEGATMIRVGTDIFGARL